MTAIQPVSQLQMSQDEAVMYWSTINGFVALIMAYGSDQVIPDFKFAMEKAKEAVAQPTIILPDAN